MTKSIPRGFAVSLIAAIACSPDLTVPENVVVNCTTQADCPNDFHCTNGGVCVPSNRDDLVAPTLSEASWGPGPDVGVGGTATLTFVVSEPLLVDPILTFISGDASYTMRRTARDADTLTYAFSYTPTGSETEGTWIVAASLLDLAGNTNEEIVPSIKLDFTPPALLPTSAALTLTPNRQTNPLIDVTAITNGTTLRLTVATNEPLAQAPTVSIEGVPIGTMTLPSSTLAILETTWSQELGIADGGHALTLTLTDPAGNTADSVIPGLTLVVDTLAPAPPTVETPGAIVLRRFPWGDGSSASGSFQTSNIIGAPASAEANARVLAYDAASIPPCASSSCTFAAQARATAPVEADGAFLLSFGLSDRSAAYIAIADAAGNVSGRVATTEPLTGTKVRDGQLMAVTPLTPQTVQQNTNSLGAAEVFAETKPVGTALAADRGLVAYADTLALTTTGAQTWTLYDEAPAGDPFSGRYGIAVGYLPTRGEVTTFGGYTSSNPPADRGTYVRDSGTMRRVATSLAPPSSNENLFAYDIANDGLLLFNGGTWLWNGFNWTPLCVDAACVATGPQSSDPVMVADPSRGVIVLLDLGANRQVWEWDGMRWTSVCDSACASGGPPTANRYGGTWDGDLRELVVFGSDPTRMWSWDGTRWQTPCTTPACSASLPSPRASPIMGFDPVRHNVVMFGGQPSGGSVNETWIWDGSVWSQHTGVGPTRRLAGQMAWDARRQRLVLVGGMPTLAGVGTGTSDTTWEWDGTRWQRWDPTSTPTLSRNLAYDPQSKLTVAPVGGSTLVWDGWAWLTSSSITGTPASTATVATPATGIRRPIALAPDGTYALTGTAWVAQCSGCKPPVSPAPLGTDGTGIIATGQGSAGDTWRWNGTTWTQACSGCTERFANGLAYGGVAGTVLSVDQGPTVSRFTTASGTWGALSFNAGGFDFTYGANAIAYDSDRNAWGIMPGSPLGRPSPGQGKQSMRLLFNGAVNAPVLATTSGSAPSGPAGSGGGVAYDEERGVIVSATSSQTGVLRTGGATKPAHIFTIGLGPVIDTRTVSITAIDVSWTGAASSKLAGVATSSVAAAVWCIDHWQPVTVSSADATHAMVHVDAASTGITIDRIVFGSGRTIVVALMPEGTNADLPAFASITTDAINAVVTYRAN